jgi:hypothetical protein
MPSLNALRECIRALNEDISENAFKEPELIGWVYQYFQTEEKNRVFEEVRTKKKKIQGDDIVSATSLYTERYMVDYLVQNSLGAIWMEMYPDSKLCEKWPYFVKDQELKPREPRPVKSLTFLDPACGSGHFLLIAFDLFVQMYEEEARLADEGKIDKEWVVPEEKIAATIIESNLHGIDIDLRSIQLSWIVLYLKMREHQISVSASKILPERVNLVAADASLLETPEFPNWCESRFKNEPYIINIIKGIASRLHNLSEIGSLARPEEDLRELIQKEKQRLISAWGKGKIQNELFPGFLTPEQRELPFEKVTDDQFWEGLIKRFKRTLGVFLKRVKEEMRERLFATELQRVIVFLDLCRKRYDVVATNPPYMKKANISNLLRIFLDKKYPSTSRDLYSAFMEDNLTWLEKQGRLAMITPASFMYKRSYNIFRNSLVNEYNIVLVVHLGFHGFEGIIGEHTNTGMHIIKNDKPKGSQFSIFTRAVSPSYLRKEEFLKRTIANYNSNKRSTDIYKINQLYFSFVRGAPFIYWCPEKIFRAFRSLEPLQNQIDLDCGVHEKPLEKILRCWWEISQKEYFVPVAMARKYCKYYGHLEYSYLITNGIDQILKNRTHHLKETILYSKVSRIGFGCRVKPPSYTNGVRAYSILPNGDFYYMLGFLNSKLVEFIVCMLNDGHHFEKGDIERVPFSPPDKKSMEIIRTLTMKSVEKIKNYNAFNLTERNYNNYNLNNQIKENVITLLYNYTLIENQKTKNIAIVLTNEYIINENVFKLYQLNKEEASNIFIERDIPVGYHKIIVGYDNFPETLTCNIPNEIIKYLKNNNRINPSLEELSQIKSRLRAIYEAGPGAKVEDVIEDEEDIKAINDEDESETGDDACPAIGKRIPIPTESFLEELSVKMEIHPISIYWLLKEMREKEGVVCWPECKRYVEDYFTVMILRMLGFRWPKQVEANEPVPEWADRDGIIPITEHTGKKTLVERIRDRIGAEFGEDRISAIETEFSDILYNAECKEAELKGNRPPGKKITLAEWLERDFFKRHISQFKKRPIAWHLTSYNGTFQALLFYHKISGDILKNLKNIYLAKVQRYYRDLLEKARNSEKIPDNLTLGKLQDIEAELEDFALKLDRVINLPYEPLIDDGVRVNIAPLQKVGLLKHPVLSVKDVERAIADRNRWREDDKEQDTVWSIK